MKLHQSDGFAALVQVRDRRHLWCTLTPRTWNRWKLSFFWNGVWKWGRGTYTPQMVIFSGNMEHDDHTLFSQIIMILTSLFLAVFSWIKKRNVIAQPVFSISPDLKPQYLPIESATSCSIPHWKHGISLRPSSNWLAKPPYLVRR